MNARRVFWDGTESMSRLWVLTKGVGPGGALHRSLDPDGWFWNQDTEFLASIVEAVDSSNVMYAQVHGSASSPKPSPISIKRPTSNRLLPPVIVPETSQSEIKALLGDNMKVDA